MSGRIRLNSVHCPPFSPASVARVPSLVPHQLVWCGVAAYARLGADMCAGRPCAYALGRSSPWLTGGDARIRGDIRGCLEHSGWRRIGFRESLRSGFWARAISRYLAQALWAPRACIPATCPQEVSSRCERLHVGAHVSCALAGACLHERSIAVSEGPPLGGRFAACLVAHRAHLAL